MSKQFTKKFKEDAVRYYQEHKDLGYEACANNLGISRTALCTWVRNAKNNNGKVATRGSGNYQSDEAKENARFHKVLMTRLFWFFLAIG